jgi:hypothetical protein
LNLLKNQTPSEMRPLYKPYLSIDDGLFEDGEHR